MIENRTLDTKTYVSKIYTWFIASNQPKTCLAGACWQVFERVSTGDCHFSRGQVEKLCWVSSFSPSFGKYILYVKCLGGCFSTCKEWCVQGHTFPSAGARENLNRLLSGSKRHVQLLATQMAVGQNRDLRHLVKGRKVTLRFFLNLNMGSSRGYLVGDPTSAQWWWASLWEVLFRDCSSTFLEELCRAARTSLRWWTKGLSCC